MNTIFIINGPNLNLTGKRETEIYGTESFDSLINRLKSEYPDTKFIYKQSNREGELIDFLHEAAESSLGIVLNAGGFTHTSVALADAIKAIKTPVIEVHLSNVVAREPYRHTSLTGSGARGIIMGFGMDSYRLAVNYLLTAN